MTLHQRIEDLRQQANRYFWHGNLVMSKLCVMRAMELMKAS